jgi:hypothetical protein
MVLRVSTIQSAFKASETRWTTYFSIPVLIKENRPIDHCKVGIVKLMKSLSDRPNLPCGASSSIQGSALRGGSGIDALAFHWSFNLSREPARRVRSNSYWPLNPVVCYCFTKRCIMPRMLIAIANNIMVAPASGIDSEVNRVTEVMRPFEKLSPGPVCGNVKEHEVASAMK